MSTIDDAVAALDENKVVVIPTDSVYGLAARLVPDAVEELFRVKRRPEEKPIAILGSTPGQLASVAVFDDAALALAREYWPGPLTLVLERAEGFELELGGDRETIGVRVPAHEVAVSLLERAGPLAVTSANRSGEPAARTVDEARAALGGDAAAYLDGGPAGGTASTVVSLVGRPRVLREGLVAGRDVLAILGSGADRR